MGKNEMDWEKYSLRRKYCQDSEKRRRTWPTLEAVAKNLVPSIEKSHNISLRPRERQR
jgi:hypothetical protein